MKPGYKTTEFWHSLIYTLLSILVACGLISAQDSATLGGALVSLATGVLALLPPAVIVLNYCTGRMQLKRQAAAKDALPAVEQALDKLDKLAPESK